MPKLYISIIPLATLVVCVALSITCFGSDALGGANQVSLLMATAVCTCLSMSIYRTPWKVIENAIEETIGTSSVSIVILLLIGMMSGTWMVAGVVPSLIYYGVQIMSPMFFLACTCIICAIVSVMTGSSWTTVATIGIAFLGIGNTIGMPEVWTAGAIISGSYFGDKISPLSDTTVLAASSAQVNLFEHIRYMLHTTIPTFTITILIFAIAGFTLDFEGETSVETILHGLDKTYNITLWTMLVPVFTGILIAKKVPALITLFLSSLAAATMAIIIQPHIVATIAGDVSDHSVLQMAKGTMISMFTSTRTNTGIASLNDLVETSGMEGMLDTVWLILCAMCFGGAMKATGMLQSITQAMLRIVSGRTTLVTATACSGLSLNLLTSDQYMSIVLNSEMYRGIYKKMGFRPHLLSRTVEDSTTVTSVLIPWNTCGMTQSTILGVATLDYLPYCFFNYLSPLMTILMARIKKPSL